jgi:hypothetical protein
MGKEKKVSAWLNDWCCRHEGHVQHESPPVRLVQWMYCAAARANASLGTPAGPCKSRACGIWSLSIMRRKRFTALLFPITSENFISYWLSVYANLVIIFDVGKEIIVETKAGILV